MEETSSIITVGISVYWKNGHTVPDQQLGCPESCLGSNVSYRSVLGQKRDVPEQSHPWCVLEPSNPVSFQDIMRLELEATLWHAGWRMD